MTREILRPSQVSMIQQNFDLQNENTNLKKANRRLWMAVIFLGFAAIVLSCVAANGDDSGCCNLNEIQNLKDTSDATGLRVFPGPQIANKVSPDPRFALQGGVLLKKRLLNSALQASFLNVTLSADAMPCLPLRGKKAAERPRIRSAARVFNADGGF